MFILGTKYSWPKESDNFTKFDEIMTIRNGKSFVEIWSYRLIYVATRSNVHIGDAIFYFVYTNRLYLGCICRVIAGAHVTAE